MPVADDVVGGVTTDNGLSFLESEAFLAAHFAVVGFDFYVSKRRLRRFGLI